MKDAILLIGVLLVFVIVFISVKKAEQFMRKNPNAFPGKRRVIKPLLKDWQYPEEEESTEDCDVSAPSKEKRNGGKEK